MFFKDPFRLVTVTDVAQVADTFTRNEIATSNEIRQLIGWKPSIDPKADELRNANISAPNGDSSGATAVSGEQTGSGGDEYDAIVNELLDSIQDEINNIVGKYMPSEGEETEEDSEEDDES